MYKLEAYLFTRCLLLVQIHSLLVTRCKISRYSLRNSLVTRCRSCLLQNVTCYSLQSYSLKKITRYSLQNSLATHCRSCSLQKFTRYSLQNSLVTRCKSCSLQKFTRYLLQNSLGTRYRSYSLQKITRYSLQKFLVVKKSFAARWNSHKSINLGESLVFSIYSNVFLKTKIFKVGPSQHITLKPPVSRTLSNTIIYKWVKSQQLLALSQRNK